jgi:hypothetical protein
MTAEISDLSIKNVYKQRNNHEILPNSIRACIIGKSGCGKTNLLMNLLLKKFGDYEYLDYNNLYIFSKSLYQPIYQTLINGMKNKLSKEQILKCITKQKFTIEPNNHNKNPIQIHCFSDSEEIPDPTEIDPNLKTLIIFDDIMFEKQNNVEKYYSHGRHNNVDCFYISQNYIKLPKNTIRENANLFILFPQSKQNLDYIYRDHCIDLNRDDFLYLCSISWKEKFGFVTIDLTNEINEGKYRKMLNYSMEIDEKE